MTAYQMAQLTSEQAVLMAELHAKCFSEGWSARSFEELLSDPSVVGLAAISDTEPQRGIGFILIRIIVDEAEILTLGVEPKQRRKKLGHTLVEGGLVRAFAQGAKEIFLEVSKSNVAAQDLYKSFGFEEVAQRRNYYQTSTEGREDALIYRLKQVNEIA